MSSPASSDSTADPSPPPKRRRSRWRFFIAALVLLAGSWAFIAFQRSQQSVTLPGPVTLTFSHVTQGVLTPSPTDFGWHPDDKCYKHPPIAVIPAWARTYNKWHTKMPKAVRDVLPKKSERGFAGLTSRSPAMLVFTFKGRFIELERDPGSTGSTLHEPWQISFVDDNGLESPVRFQSWDDSPTGTGNYESGWVVIESFPRRSEWLHLRVRPTHNRVEFARSPIAGEMRFRNPARDLSPPALPPTPAGTVADFFGNPLELVSLTRSRNGKPDEKYRMKCELHLRSDSSRSSGLEFDSLWLGDDYGNFASDCFGYSGSSRTLDGKSIMTRKWNGSIWSDVPVWKFRLELRRGPWHPELFTPQELFSFRGIPAPSDSPQSLNQSATVGPRTIRLSKVQKGKDGAGELEIVIETPTLPPPTSARLIIVHAQDDQGRSKGLPPDTDYILPGRMSSHSKHVNQIMHQTYRLRLNLPPDSKTFDVSFAMESTHLVDFRVPVTVVD